MDEYDYIGNYFNGLLSPGEMKQFDEKIQQDPAFAEDVAFYCSSLQQIKNQVAEEKKTRFRELYQQGNITGSTVVVKRLWPYMSAAAVLAAIVLGLYLFNTASSPGQMADSYVQEKLQTMSVTMGTEDSLQKGKRLYNERKFTDALNQFKAILRTDTGNIEAKKSAGIVSLRLQQYDQAVEYFTQIENSTLFSNPGKFYHALTLMERNHPNDKQEARLLLEQVVKYDLEGREKAEEWLKKW